MAISKIAAAHKIEPAQTLQIKNKLQSLQTNPAFHKEAWHTQMLGNDTFLLNYVEGPNEGYAQLLNTLDVSPNLATQQLLLDWFLSDRNEQETVLALPVIPNKINELDRLVQTLKTARLTYFSACQTRLGITKTSWHQQRTVQAETLLLIYLEGANPWLSLANLNASQEPFDLWLKQALDDVTILDLSQSLTQTSSQAIFRQTLI